MFGILDVPLEFEFGEIWTLSEPLKELRPLIACINMPFWIVLFMCFTLEIILRHERFQHKKLESNFRSEWELFQSESRIHFQIYGHVSRILKYGPLTSKQKIQRYFGGV